MIRTADGNSVRHGVSKSSAGDPAIMAIVQKPRVGVSACLLGDNVRYDGGHKFTPALVDLVGPDVEWFRVCPEVEVGMGTPREPLNLLRDGDRLRMISVHSGIDYTDRMNDWARRRVEELARADLDGYVLKSGSPSCGLEGPGLFASALIRSLPFLPVIDEKQLQDPQRRAEFVERVVAHCRERTA